MGTWFLCSPACLAAQTRSILGTHRIHRETKRRINCHVKYFLLVFSLLMVLGHPASVTSLTCKSHTCSVTSSLTSSTWCHLHIVPKVGILAIGASKERWRAPWRHSYRQRLSNMRSIFQAVHRKKPSNRTVSKISTVRLTSCGNGCARNASVLWLASRRPFCSLNDPLHPGT